MSATTLESISISAESDIMAARQAVRGAASKLSFTVTDVTRIVTASSELARNILLYAGSGIMRCSILDHANHRGIELTFEDKGPGIPDIELALKPGYTTSKGLGLGLSGAKRLMDEMEIESMIGKGTRVTVRKWLRS
jgi:serine/threonine-protein kinase RsbT